jgi:hypothetical protein
MGEQTNRQIAAALDTAPMVVDTMGGRMHVHWDEAAHATPNGQLVFFAEFLATAGVFDAWVDACPLTHRGGNTSDKRDVLGTLTLAVLAGHRRYSHVTALRGDAVAAQALGMKRTVSEDTVRRSLLHIDAPASEAWLRPALMTSVHDALEQPWIMDIDASIKPLYGRQDGAELGYNPHKPGRPSHVLHTFWVSNLRLVLDVQVSPGNQHTSLHARAGLGRLLDELGERRPALVRGDCGYGNEGVLIELEQRTQPYLLRLRQTKNVKRLITRLAGRSDWGQADAQGFQAIESELRLQGWSRTRRVILVRRRIRDDVTGTSRKDPQQLRLPIEEAAVLDAHRMWEYTMLVTDVSYPLDSIAQLYRDRCDCENGFDELKNQWGLGGFTTHDITRCQTTARIGALVYNWWSWYCRAAHPQGRLEAVTSRPLLLAAVGKSASHAGGTQLYLTPLHAMTQTIRSLVGNIRKALQHVKQLAEQSPKLDRWRALLRYICSQIVPSRLPQVTHDRLVASG